MASSCLPSLRDDTLITCSWSLAVLHIMKSTNSSWRMRLWNGLQRMSWPDSSPWRRWIPAMLNSPPAPAVSTMAWKSLTGLSVEALLTKPDLRAEIPIPWQESGMALRTISRVM